MTSPREQWPALFWFFDVMHQDYNLEFADKDACLREATSNAETPELEDALRQWHEAFDKATAEDSASIVQTFNPWWDADREFGGYRGWANWVREHLEAELARRRAADSTAI